MLKVLELFDDLQDLIQTSEGLLPYRYTAGDSYPRAGYTPTEERIAELAGEHNRRGMPLIVMEEDEAEIAPAQKTKSRSRKTSG